MGFSNQEIVDLIVDFRMQRRLWEYDLNEFPEIVKFYQEGYCSEEIEEGERYYVLNPQGELFIDEQLKLILKKMNDYLLSKCGQCNMADFVAFFWDTMNIDLVQNELLLDFLLQQGKNYGYNIVKGISSKKDEKYILL